MENSIIKQIRQKAKEKNRKKEVRVILPESEDVRVLKAASMISEKGIAKVILFGSPKKIMQTIKKVKISFDTSKIEIIDHLASNKKEEYAKVLYNIRKNKGMTIEKARKLIDDPMYFATVMVKEGAADAIVSGASRPSPEVLRPALQIIRAKNGFASTFLLMVGKVLGKERAIIFADCSLNVNPNAKELALIAEQSAESGRLFLKTKPKIALLSFSTKGSAKDSSLDNLGGVRNALKIVKKKLKGVVVDGEFQLDTALIPDVAKLKAPDSSIKGDANILIFPDLNSGNIGYKLAERFGDAIAIGPVMQGLNKPVSDLSRGCSVEDIINIVSIVVLQAKG